jgi:Tfp pilus assembly protein PilE
MRTSERGETLLELVVSVAIMGIIVIAFAGGLIAVTFMSDVHRKQASAGAYVRDYAEAIEKWVATPGNYPGCASGTSADYTAVAVPSFPVSGYAKSAAAVCAPGTPDVAQLTLTVNSTDNRASEKLVIFVRRPCSTPC